MQRIMAHYHNLEYHTEVGDAPRRSEMGKPPMTIPIRPPSALDMTASYNFDPRLLGDSDEDSD